MKRRIILLAFVGIVLVSGLVGAATPPEDPHNTTNVDGQDGWMVGLEEPTLDNIVTLLLRVPSYLIIGSSSGELAAGILVAGVVIGAVGPNRIGFVAGGFVGVVTAMAIAATGIAPPWIEVAVMMLIGLFLAVVYLRFK